MTTRSDHSVLYRGGHVYTAAAAGATSLATVGGDVAWVGADPTGGPYADGADEIVELEGSLVTAAFVDAHAHLAQTGIAARTLDLTGVENARQLLDSVSRYATQHPDEPVLGHGWDESRWTTPDLPGRAALERAVGGRPAYLSRVDAHSALASPALLEQVPQAAGLEGWSDDGPVTRGAHHAVRGAAHRLTTGAFRERAIRDALGMAAACGIGMVHDLGGPHLSGPDDLTTARRIAGGERTPDVVSYWGDLFAGSAVPAGIRGFAGDLCVDGSVGSRTAAFTTPYADASTRGHRYLTAAQVRDHVVACTVAGVQAGFHVIGDDAVATALAGVREAAERVGTDAIRAARHRLEHVELIDGKGMQTMAELGVVASVQPAFDAAWGGTDALYASRLGSARASRMNAFAGFRRVGVTLAFGSDTPVTPFNPWGGVRAAVHHRTPGQQIGTAAAFDAHTRGGHRAARNDWGGVLAPGREATLAIWDVPVGADVRPASTPALPALPALPDLRPGRPLPQCRRTVVRGTTVFAVEAES